MTLTQTHAKFTATSHTLIHALNDRHLAQDAANEIARIYWPPVYAYLRHTGMSRDQAAETTQAFFVNKVFSNELFQKTDPQRGRVRNLLLASLKNFVIDQHRKEVSRGKGQLIPLDAIYAEESPRSNQAPHAAFDFRWASAQLEESMRRCKAHFESCGRHTHWEAFADRIYHPSVYNSTPTPLKTLALRLGFSSAADTAAAVQLVKRRSISFLHEIVTESTAPGLESETEFNRILDLLQSPPT